MKPARSGSERQEPRAECALDSQECVSLHQILKSFNTTISEEHAWALFYQSAKCFLKCLQEKPDRCYLINSPSDIVLHKDGTVHPKTLIPEDGDVSREHVASESQLVVKLALVIYQALDYAHSDDEERLISPDLEGLINEMTASDEPDEDGSVLSEGSEGGGAADTDDEGIERDSEPTPRNAVTQRRKHATFLLGDVIERCTWHCGGRSARDGRSAREAAAAHYRAVCRALLAEALELSSFLAKVKDGGVRDLGADKDACHRLGTLQFSDWARFWMQVIGELRMGVKLKKVDYSRTPIEYELTPYEILMDDIRSRRYTLRKVEGEMRVKKDAHAMILEFIRSRPPLRKASERKLPPLNRESTPRERLLESIQKGRSLRRIYSGVAEAGSVNCPGGDATPVMSKPQRRLIQVDFDDLEDDEDDDESEMCASPENRTSHPQPLPRTTPPQPTAKPWKRTGSPPRPAPRTKITHDEYHQFCDTALESYDLATQCPSRRASMRRHTFVAPSLGDGTHSVPQSRPGSRQSGIAPSCGSSEGEALGGDLSWSRSSLQDDLIKSVSSAKAANKQWQEAILSDDRLSLTLEEIVHIRSVLTKAELEVLPVEGRVKEDVEKRKVCFLCLKTRFGIFGPWGHRCRLCKKTVCQKCQSKMHIPTEHFSNVPVVLLSPSLISSPEEEVNTSFPRSLMQRLMHPENPNVVDNSVGSAPSSPAMQRHNMVRSVEGTLGGSAPGSRGSSALGFVGDNLTLPPNSIMSRSIEAPGSLPVHANPLGRRSRYSRANTLGGSKTAEKLRGMPMVVCLDCKALVLEIIKSSRTSRSATRNYALKNLKLALEPVYTSNC